ncbi:Serine/threonine-protein kinase BRSK2 [Trichoplax sp. H2]|nr:Serine/threonine-protein kinase BRSK2 [Trichoplax sp. H2]|eukprot:RDD39174.1 Serine/threonine-protein kinase BRSK2 [Trichoplax sp. H2]
MADEHQFVGPYILERTLGKGQTGLVKLGIHCQTRKKVAIKIICRDKLSKSLLSKVEREITIMKLIEHPHVLGLFDVYENKKMLYLVLEHVSGGELFDYLVKKGRLSPKEARKYFRQIISALDFCQSHCICHRDLKPENLLLDGKMNIKVADFGMASLQVEDAMLETSCGSPHYVCPEIIRGEKYDGRKADVWSAGVILFALLVGSLPFDDENLRRLLDKVKKGNFSIPDFVPSECQDLLKRMIEKDPEKRYSIADVYKHPWMKDYCGEVELEAPMQDVVQTEMISSESMIDLDVFDSMTSLGCFKDKDDLKKKLLDPHHNTQKVVYYLLLDRKLRKPAVNDVDPFFDLDISDPPRKRVDSFNSPRQSPRPIRKLTDTPPITRPRSVTVSSAGSPQPLNVPYTNKRDIKVDNTPKRISQIDLSSDDDNGRPGTPAKDDGTNGQSPQWKSKISNIKKSIIGTPRFHRRKMIVTEPGNDDSTPTIAPDSPETAVKKSWFSQLVGNIDSDDVFVIIKDKNISMIKADLIQALLSMKDLTHQVTSATQIIAEIKKSSVFQSKPLKFMINIESSKTNSDSLYYTVTMKLLTSGQKRRFKKIADNIQKVLLLPRSAAAGVVKHMNLSDSDSDDGDF